MSSTTCYSVTAEFLVVDRVIGNDLLQPFTATYLVQPPAYAVGDEAMLEMHLELLAKLKCLYILRARVKAGEKAVAVLADRDFTVKGEITLIVPPARSLV